MSLWKNVFAAHRSRASQPAPPSAPEPRRLGLALGGGGGKGGAHLGILHILREHGVEIDAIAGTSIGAAVGVLYAAGFTLEEIKQAFRGSAIRRIAVPDSSRLGLISNKRRQLLLERLLGDRTFADLSIPCAVVAVDLIKGEEVVINQGPLVPALLASTALPGIFTPVQYGDKLLVDGGVLNNLPVDVAFALGAHKVIAVELTGVHNEFTLPTDTPNNPLARLTLAPRQVAIAHRAFALLMDAACQRRLAQSPPDLLIRPDVGALDTLDMNRPEAGYTLGEAAAREQIDTIKALGAWRNGLDFAPLQPSS